MTIGDLHKSRVRAGAPIYTCPICAIRVAFTERRGNAEWEKFDHLTIEEFVRRYPASAAPLLRLIVEGDEVVS